MDSTCFSSFVNNEEVAFDREVELLNLEFSKRDDKWLTRFVFDVNGDTLTIFIKDDKKLDRFEEDNMYKVIVTKTGTFIGKEFFERENLSIFTNA